MPLWGCESGNRTGGRTIDMDGAIGESAHSALRSLFILLAETSAAVHQEPLFQLCWGWGCMYD